MANEFTEEQKEFITKATELAACKAELISLTARKEQTSKWTDNPSMDWEGRLLTAQINALKTRIWELED